jgi:hypothetical protein
MRSKTLVGAALDSPEFRPDRSRPARLTFSDYYGHACSIHGPRPMRVNRNVEPTESGSYYYSCSVCGAGGWSGL